LIDPKIDHAIKHLFVCLTTGLFEFTVIQSNTNITGKRDGRQPIYHRYRRNDWCGSLRYDRRL